VAIDVRHFVSTPALPGYRRERPAISVRTDGADGATVVGRFVGASGDAGPWLGGRESQRIAGFDAAVGQTIATTGDDGRQVVLVGCGDTATLDATAVRDAAGALGSSTSRHRRVAVRMPSIATLPPDAAAQSIVEGVLLARYRFDALKRSSDAQELEELTLVVDDESDAALAESGAARGLALATVTRLARDLANTPHSHLSAVRMAEIAQDVGAASGLEVQVFDEDALRDLGCGGLLGVNAGSNEPPRMIKLVYRPPAGASGTSHLALVGKGIMYDSGGLSLKPGDEVHAQMKNDMSGAGAVLAAMSGLRELGCTSNVTGWLMCTDNMPSGTAMALGDVITMRGGTTVEVVNTDAEGRLIMADALVLATEESPDAIVDIATLTGACMRALGTQIAGVLGNDEALLGQVESAAESADEPVWRLPLATRYRKELDSGVADLKNLGGANAGAITAALFLAEFVGTTPWAHIDIAGTANNATANGWRTAGCTGFGARLLAELALAFVPPSS
jgi:leucyl aminopeptidase